MPRAPICFGGWAGTARPRPPTSAQPPWHRRTPSGTSSGSVAELAWADPDFVRNPNRFVAVVGLVIGDVLEYGSGHGMGHQEILALFDLQSGLYFASWGIAAAFLALAPTSGRLRRSAVVIAGLQLIAMAAPTAGPSRLPNMLFLVWIIVASVSLARRPRAVPTPAPVAARP